MLRNMRRRIGEWYRGEYVMRRNDPGSPLVAIGGHRRPGAGARLARAVGGFLGREWKWLVGVAVSIAGVIVAYLKLG